jgi:hypothetical protein
VCPSGFSGSTCEKGIKYNFATIGTGTQFIIYEYSCFQFCVINMYPYVITPVSEHL